MGTEERLVLRRCQQTLTDHTYRWVPSDLLDALQLHLAGKQGQHGHLSSPTMGSRAAGRECCGSLSIDLALKGEGTACKHARVPPAPTPALSSLAPL